MSLPTTSTAPALFVDQNNEFKVLRFVPVPELVEGELIVKVLYSGVNPADVKHAPLLGINSTILGYDFCGHVVKANENSEYKIGDLVAGFTPFGVGQLWKHGAHQEYLSNPEELTFKVPKNMTSVEAASLTTILMTAADGIYSKTGYSLPSGKHIEGFRSGPLLVWGGATSVGIAMIQLARASGAHPILVTASPKRHELLKKLGATYCFDYNSSDVAGQIKAVVGELKAGPIAYAADCAGYPGTEQEPSSAAQMAACVEESDKATFISVIPQPDKRFKFIFACADRESKMNFPGKPTVTVPARPEDFKRMRAALLWSVENYGNGFVMPSVEVFKGRAEDALEQIHKIAVLGRFGKLVLEHPLL
ncbi:uncharacterized protein CTRU02_202899 [Colletotrichum truncatum]|uniref:Uncharacterized protein n=1 Tax=Colletotrichum truncatum TaxID=5467 RepID=A0ACC3ZLK1_COLTU|nr:uncharacterized protein CTRU02_12992 [Colletotrichum truncatum]KAF6783976.1 hypothetical protein CTRU02_12992 [Colletotrichum truncatum]